MVLSTPRYVGPTIVVSAAFDALLFAPYALFQDFLVEIELYIFNLVTPFEVLAAGVEIQVVFLAMVHKAIDRLCASVAVPFAIVMASSGWDSEELEGGSPEEFMRTWWHLWKHTRFVKIKITFFASVSWPKSLFLATITGVRFQVLLQLQFMPRMAWITQPGCHFFVLLSRGTGNGRAEEICELRRLCVSFERKKGWKSSGDLWIWELRRFAGRLEKRWWELRTEKIAGRLEKENMRTEKIAGRLEKRLWELRRFQEEIMRTEKIAGWDYEIECKAYI